jgi:hypothetical protein
MRELLRDAAPGNAGNIDFLVAELRNEIGSEPCQRSRPIR